ncbi:MAG: hypothetical protein Tsb009_21970 [Planctomycetaceae bacterium]
MADFLALDWDSRHLSGLHAQVNKDKVRIKNFFSLLWPDEDSPNADSSSPDDSNKGEWLSAQLKELKISASRVLVCLPREAAVVRQLEVPNIPDEELPDIVRLQAETKMSSSLDRQLLDFLPLPKREGATTREVLITTIPRELSNSIRKTVEAAGLELVSIGLSPVAMTELVSRVESSQSMNSSGASLVLARHNRRLEISLVCEGQLLFTHSAELAGESESQDIQLALAEVSRSFIALERSLAGQQLARAWVIGDKNRNAALCEALNGRLSCSVHTLEPVTDLKVSIDANATNANAAQFAGPLGMLLSTGNATVPTVDFLNPRKAIKRIDRKTLRLRVIAGVVASLFVAVGVFLFMYNKSLANDLNQKNQELAKTRNLIRASKPTLDSAGILGKWDQRNLVWPEQLRELKKALPGTDRIYLTEIHFFPSRKKTYLARVSAIGFAINRADVEALKQKLADMKYVVNPTAVKESQKDPKYRYRFELDLELPVPKKTPANKKTAKK